MNSYKEVKNDLTALFSAVIKRAIKDLYGDDICMQIDAYAFLAGQGRDLEWWCTVCDVDKAFVVDSLEGAHAAKLAEARYLYLKYPAYAKNMQKRSNQRAFSYNAK